MPPAAAHRPCRGVRPLRTSSPLPPGCAATTSSMVSGTDEHGTPVMVIADDEGCCRVRSGGVQRADRDDLRKLDQHDLFTRTTTASRCLRRPGLPGTSTSAASSSSRRCSVRFSSLHRLTRSPTATSREAFPICRITHRTANEPSTRSGRTSSTDPLIDLALENGGATPSSRDEASVPDLPRSAISGSSQMGSSRWTSAANVRNLLSLRGEIKPRPITRDLDWVSALPLQLLRKIRTSVRVVDRCRPSRSCSDRVRAWRGLQTPWRDWR